MIIILGDNFLNKTFSPKKQDVIYLFFFLENFLIRLSRCPNVTIITGRSVHNCTNLMLKMMIVVLANYHLSVTLKEWLKLNVGIISKEDHVDKQTIKIFATHHAKT